jgi:N-ethylmaleimide reductase
MAPLTRNWEIPGGDVPGPLAPAYYGPRSGFGLIVSEGTEVSPQGQGYAWTPGMPSAAQVEGWRPVTEAVHSRGGTIVAQIWNVGRVSHTTLQPGGAAPIGPSALAANSRTFDGRDFVATSAHGRWRSRRFRGSSPPSPEPSATPARPASTGSSSTAPTAT